VGPGTFLLTRTAQVDKGKSQVYFNLLSKTQLKKAIRLNSALVPILILLHFFMPQDTKNVVGSALKHDLYLIVIVIAVSSLRTSSSFIHRFLWGSDRGSHSLLLMNLCNIVVIISTWALSHFSFRHQQSTILVLIFTLPLALELIYIIHFRLLVLLSKFEGQIVREIRSDILENRSSIRGGSAVATLGTIGFKLDSIIVGVFCSPLQVVNLGIVSKIFGVIVSLLDVAAKKWWVFFARNINPSNLPGVNAYLKRTYLQILAYSTFSIFTTVLFFEPIVILVTGEQSLKIQSSLIAAVGFLTFLSCIAGPGAMLISASSLSHRTLPLQTCASILNLLLSIFLIANVGPVGSPIASGIATLILIPGEFFISKKYRENLRRII
jgi:O-antigen/teichoic acid export membrane protein